MPIELPVSFKNVLEAMGQTVPEGEYKSVMDELLFPQGDTLRERFSDVYGRLEMIAASLGIDFDATDYTFTVTKSRNNGKVYINFPAVRLVDGLPTLTWGNVSRPITELTCKAQDIKTVPSLSNKPGARPKYYLEVKLQSKDWKAIGVTSVIFPLSTVDNVDPMLLAEAMDTDPDDNQYQYRWSKVLRAKGTGNFKAFAKSLGHIFRKHPEFTAISDESSFFDAVSDSCNEATCEPLSIRVKVEAAEIESGKFGESLVMSLTDVSDDANPCGKSYGRYKVGMNTTLGRRYDIACPDDFIGTEFTVVAEGVSEYNGKPFVKTRIEEVVMGCQKDGLPSWDSVRSF